MSGPRPLTARQREVLRLVAAGRTAIQIGRQLGIEHTTVNKILGLAYQALGASDRAHAVAIALAVGELGVHEIFVPEEQRESAA